MTSPEQENFATDDDDRWADDEDGGECFGAVAKAGASATTISNARGITARSRLRRVASTKNVAAQVVAVAVSQRT